MSWVRDASAFLPSLLRLGRGLYPSVRRDQRSNPARMLELFEFEACPYCRKVREVLSELDLDYRVHPVAEGSPRRAELRRRGGKEQVPYLIDPNTGSELYESADIIDYLNRRYGGGHPAGWSLPVPAFVDDLGSTVASVARLGAGRTCRVRRRQEPTPLELFNMEGSPYCRKVREALCELDLPYVVFNVPKGSPQREELAKRGGKVQVPYLIDPNQGREMYESDDILTYLEETYGPKGV